MRRTLYRIDQDARLNGTWNEMPGYQHNRSVVGETEDKLQHRALPGSGDRRIERRSLSLTNA
jgi:hypothetical protein